MFFRQKRSGKHTYLQIVENRWENGRSKQRVIATLGRLDDLRDEGRLDGLLRSGAKLSEAAILLTAQQKGELPVIATTRIGPALIFERLSQQGSSPRPSADGRGRRAGRPGPALVLRTMARQDDRREDVATDR